MRIVSWNMNQRGAAAWAFLEGTLDPDIALLQEAVVPEGITDQYQVLWTPGLTNGRWGSAILSRVGDLALDWEDRSRGAVLVAHGSLPRLGPVSISSVHARVIGRRVIPALSLTFDDLRTNLGERFIVGGDLNTARAAALAWPENGHGEFWAALDASEFRDCYYLLNEGERQSFWREQHQGKPATIGNSLMDDHVFVDAETFGYVTGADVWDTPEIRKLSDHGPVVVDVGLPGQDN
jgi:exonuclease III